MTLAILLKNARKKIGLSQSEVAEMLNISRQSVSNWENERAYPDIDNLLLLGEIYKISLDELNLKNKLMEGTTYPEHKIKPKDESALLGIFLLIGFFIPFFGVIAPFFILYKNKKTNAFYYVIIVASICCIIFSIFSSFVILNNPFWYR